MVPPVGFTKHGHGIEHHLDDAFAARYRAHRLAQKYTTKDIVLTVVVTVLVMTFAMMLTDRWVGV